MQELKVQFLKQKLQTGQELRETPGRKKRAILINVGREDIKDKIFVIKRQEKTISSRLW